MMNIVNIDRKIVLGCYLPHITSTALYITNDNTIIIYIRQ